MLTPTVNTRELTANLYRGNKMGKAYKSIPIADLSSQETMTRAVIQVANGSYVSIFRSGLDQNCYNIATPLWAGFISFRNGICVSFATTKNPVNAFDCSGQLLGLTYSQILMQMIAFSEQATPVRMRYYSGARLNEYNLVPYSKEAHERLLKLEQLMFADPCYNPNNGTMQIEVIYE